VSSNQSTTPMSSTMPKGIAVRPQPQHPSSPFKRTPAGIVSSLNTVAEPLSVSSNGSDAGSSSSTSHATSGQVILPLQLTTTTSSDQTAASCGFHTGNLPAVADVRSPDVLHALKQSSSTEELHAEMKNLEGLMKDLNSISNPSILGNVHATAHNANQESSL